MLKAVIFDMDGTMVDTEPMHYEANYDMLKELGINLDYEYYKQYIGSTNTYMWNKIKKDFSLELPAEQLNQMADQKNRELVQRKGYPEIAGVKTLIRKLKEDGYRLAVASSSPPAVISQVVDFLGVSDCFFKLVSGENVVNPKPAPDIFLEAATALGVKTEDCLVIEDSCNGVLAAKAAGMVCVGYQNPHSGEQDLSAADYLIEGFLEVDSRFLEMVYCHAMKEP